MATQNILNMTEVEEALRSYYLPGLRYQLNEETSAFLAQIEKTTENVEGKDIVMAMRYGRVGGIGNRADDGDLPRPNSRKTKQANWETKNLFARFMITDKTIKASRSNVASFARLLQQEIEDAETDAKQDLSRQVMTDEYGLLAKVDENKTAEKVFEVDDIQFLVEGLQVDIYEGSTDTKREELVEITAVFDSSKEVAVADDVTVETGDEIFIAGNRNKELFGVGAIFDNDQEIYNLDRDTYPWLRAQKIDLEEGGDPQDLSETIIQKAIDDANEKTGADIDFIMCSYGVKRGYQALLTGTRRYHNTKELEGGWTVLTYNDIPLVADKYMPPKKMRLLDLGDWKMYQMADYEWLDRDGSMFRAVADKAAFEATLAKYCDIGCQKPRGQVEIDNIKEY